MASGAGWKWPAPDVGWRRPEPWRFLSRRQETMDSKLLAMKHENEALWREVASLRQKHAQQQKVVNKLIQFLISLVQSNRILGVKRKIPLMLNDGGAAHSMPKFGRQYSLEHLHGAGPFAAPSPAYSGSSLYSPDAMASSGPIISDITELAPGSPPTGKQLVHYTAQPLLLVDPGHADVGGDLPVLFELGGGPYFSEGDDYSDDPTISLLAGSEPPKAQDPAVS
ncbi:PREDICTED: heat shock factor protein 1 [Condylura cristata]|uniref:heat shock factor protein 1 n=1 Tax=Condylura cristata TaxID=143302 RepID=UPI0006435375|nr:PREDICTED: heat shock factor protein 1 [Condylura cristata]